MKIDEGVEQGFPEDSSNGEYESFIGNEIKGKLIGDESRKGIYKALQTGIYRFDFEIDDVNNAYSFYIYDSKNDEYDFKIYDGKREEIVSTFSSKKGMTVELESGGK